MDPVSSSSDSKSIVELAAEVTWFIAELDISIDNVLDIFKDISKSVNLIKQNALKTHEDADESRREEMLCYLALLGSIRVNIKTLSDKMDIVNCEIEQSMTN